MLAGDKDSKNKVGIPLEQGKMTMKTKLIMKLIKRRKNLIKMILYIRKKRKNLKRKDWKKKRKRG
jgi:hypothetical protein